MTTKEAVSELERWRHSGPDRNWDVFSARDSEPFRVNLNGRQHVYGQGRLLGFAVEDALRQWRGRKR